MRKTLPHGMPTSFDDLPKLQTWVRQTFVSHDPLVNKQTRSNKFSANRLFLDFPGKVVQVQSTNFGQNRSKEAKFSFTCAGNLAGGRRNRGSSELETSENGEQGVARSDRPRSCARETLNSERILLDIVMHYRSGLVAAQSAESAGFFADPNVFKCRFSKRTLRQL